MGDDIDLLLPVGHDLGPFHPDLDAPLDYYEICVGRRSYALKTVYDYAVWMRAHGPIDVFPMTFDRYLGHLMRSDIPDAVQRAADLASAGLLWDVPLNRPPAVEFARSYRPMPLVTAIGDAGPDAPAGTYALGRPTKVFLHADAVEYWLWLWGGRFDSLWLATEAFAATDLGAETAGGDPHACLSHVLLAAQNLISHSLLFLDAAWNRR